jgi:hypothetical protein
MQMRFYDGASFPGAYRNSAFVAMHGSWNRKPASGYEVIRGMFSSAGDFVGFEPFVTGFLQLQPNTAPPLPGAQPLPPDGYIGGRPTGIAVAKDGALLVGDDSNNVIYRVVYGAAPRVTAQKLSLDILDARERGAVLAYGEFIAHLGTRVGTHLSTELDDPQAMQSSRRT